MNFYKNKNENIIIFIIFLLFFIIGINSFKDYGISLDENYHRENGLMWFSYLKGFFNEEAAFRVNRESINSEIANGNYLPLHAITFDLPLEILIQLFNIEGSKSIIQFRHLFNFIFFLIGLYFFYKLIRQRFPFFHYQLIGLFFLFLSPRMFAESFYNNKDIFFLSLIIVNMYTGINFLQKPNFINSLWFSFSSALAFDTRLMAVFFPIIIFLFIFMNSLSNKDYFIQHLKYFISFFIFAFFFVIIFWPYLWQNPIGNLFYALKMHQNLVLELELQNLYFANHISSKNLPWHYSFVWIGITTPLIIIALFLFGFFSLIAKISKRFLELEGNQDDVWKGKNEIFDICFLLMCILPLILIIKYNVNFDGWRHLYFIYPSIIMIALYGLHYLDALIKNYKIKKLLYIVVTLNLIYLSFWNYKFHPFQNVYFNHLIKDKVHGNFDLDYWGLSNRSAMEHIIKNNVNYPIKIGTISFSSLETSLSILNDEDKSKILITHNLDNADFLITNYRKKMGENFKIDKSKYEKYHEILVDKIPINTIYRKVD